jgi:uncharacterized protein YgbK (DUF1537 family)
MRLGVIADDFTGTTDIAGFLVANGLRAVQLNGMPPADLQAETDAVVVSLKTRTGACCRAASRPGAQSTTTSGPGAGPASGSAFT